MYDVMFQLSRYYLGIIVVLVLVFLYMFRASILLYQDYKKLHRWVLNSL